ncbi:MAG: response regulator [Chloroflexi bacterium]|nr:response regulator [Chloroflexota bacterium]
MTTATGKTHTVLYIEDNASNLLLVQQILARRGDIQLLTATTGREGIEHAHTHQLALILLDVNLPDLRGEELMRALHNDSRTRFIPVVIVSASAMPADIDRLMQMGARKYLTKPLDVKQFLQTMDEMLK